MHCRDFPTPRRLHLQSFNDLVLTSALREYRINHFAPSLASAPPERRQRGGLCSRRSAESRRNNLPAQLLGVKMGGYRPWLPLLRAGLAALADEPTDRQPALDSRQTGRRSSSHPMRAACAGTDALLRLRPTIHRYAEADDGIFIRDGASSA